MFVVSKLGVLSTARALDDELKATASITRCGGATIGFSIGRRGETVLVEGDVQIACVDGHGEGPGGYHICWAPGGCQLVSEGDTAW